MVIASKRYTTKRLVVSIGVHENLSRRVKKMCYTCGCKLPFESHGDPANIVEDDLIAAGQTDTVGRAGVTAAKQNMLELIRLEREAGELATPRSDYNDPAAT